MSMKDAMVPRHLLCYQPLPAGGIMDDEKTPHKGGERIAKVIARAGLASRREAELWIAAGRVVINGKIALSPAFNVTARDRIIVDGEPLPTRERTRLFLYHKPRGVMTTHADPQGRPTIFKTLPKSLPRLISIGRLDFNTEGLLLLTNDGALARVLELPATGWLRRYRVRAHGEVTQDKLDALRAGVTISGIHYGEIEAAIDRVQGSNLWLTFAIREGKNREVRNVLGHLGLEVTRLIRLSFGPFQLGELAEGTIEEVRTRVLREQLGERLVAQSGADFSSPIAASPPRQKRDDAHQGTPPKPTSHSWRAPIDERSKKLHRTFHGSRRDDAQARRQPAAKTRPGEIMDRKGRRVHVERSGEPPRPQPKTEVPKRGRSGRSSPDRSAGPRPHQPAGRRGRSSPDRSAGPRPRQPKGRR
jgi:23S rRNA pseudouridine2605 synthase